MARRVRNADIETREARRKLKARGLPYWTRLEEGLHLGYRRQKGASKWIVRFYLGKGGVPWVYRGKAAIKEYEMKAIGEADDFSDANGVSILTYDQAQDKARAMKKRRVFAEAGIVEGPYTVRHAVGEYLEFLKAGGKDHKKPQAQVDAHILPELADIEVASLTSARLRKWLSDIAHRGARVRTTKGKAQNFKETTSEEALRRRKSSANRTLTILKAALNHAYDERRVSSNDAWGRRVKPFRGVEGARLRYLSTDEAQRLINAADGEFRDLVQAALQTGCRFGELARLTVSDFNSDTGTVYVQKSKSGKSRHVILTEEGAAFFATLCAGRAGHERLLRREWYNTAQQRVMRETLQRAKITPHISFHGLRHTWASLAVMNGVPLQVIAQNLGHTDTRMVEKHYGHMSRSHVADAIRAGAPRFGMVKRTTVRRLARGRR